MKRSGWMVVASVWTAVFAGCVERRYVVYTDPPGAVVLRNGQILGQAPVDDYFTYYGRYNFTLMKEGFETQQVQQEIKSPWYELPGLDFFSENVVPWQIIDRRVFTYHLEPRHVANPQQLLEEAQDLRNRGLGLGAGSAQAQAPPPAATAPPAPPPAASP